MKDTEKSEKTRVFFTVYDNFVVVLFALRHPVLLYEWENDLRGQNRIQRVCEQLDHRRNMKIRGR